MAVDPIQIQLTAAQQAELAKLSDATGKPWTAVLNEALATYREEGVVKMNGERASESFLAAADRLGLIGCLAGGPADLSTNSGYMQGFGRQDGTSFRLIPDSLEAK